MLNVKGNGCLLIITYLIFLSLAINKEISSQLIPIPPPSPSIEMTDKNDKTKNDRMPPMIKILTNEIKHGKNVFKVNIVDESHIQLREIRYIYEGNIRTEGLVKDNNDIYKGLIDVKGPSAVIIINAGDEYGNKAKVSKVFEIKQSQDLFSGIAEYFFNIFH
jgi:translation initiation factor 1 (eIF-1/SUI1)